MRKAFLKVCFIVVWLWFDPDNDQIHVPVFSTGKCLSACTEGISGGYIYFHSVAFHDWTDCLPVRHFIVLNCCFFIAHQFVIAPAR